MVGGNFHSNRTARARHETEHPRWAPALRRLVLEFAEKAVVKKVFRELGHQRGRQAQRAGELCSGCRTVCTEVSKDC
ncbi:hypothetical protein GCM10009655_25430 [Rhodoglobus aureus]|uniref:Uncharacterized protein n=1 Tax=Rhodoglobus aureus TaxID=191497 RepID=A0ABN1VWF1_9MICO